MGQRPEHRGVKHPAVSGLNSGLDFAAWGPVTWKNPNGGAPQSGEDFWTIPSLSSMSIEIELMVLIYGLVLCLRPDLIIETGCHLGVTTRVLGQAVQVNGRGRVIACDIVEGYVTQAQQRCTGLPVETRVCKGEELPELGQADVALIDSSYEGRVEEIRRLKSGAIALLHDTRIINEMRIQLESFPRCLNLPTARGLALIQIP